MREMAKVGIMRDMKVVMRRKMKNILVMTKMMAMMMKSGVGLGER